MQLLDPATPAVNGEVAAALESLLAGYFTLVDDSYHNDFFNKIVNDYKDLENAHKKRTENATAARQANVTATSRQRNDKRNVHQNIESRIKNLDIYPPTPQGGRVSVDLEQGEGKGGAGEGVLKPVDVTDQVWADFLDGRKKITQTALDAIDAEAAKANMSLAEAIAMCARKGWKNFSAEWVFAEKDRAYSAADDAEQKTRASRAQEEQRNGYQGSTSPLTIFKPEPSIIPKMPKVEGQLTEADCPPDLSPKLFEKFLAFRTKASKPTTKTTIDELVNMAVTQGITENNGKYRLLLNRNTAIAAAP